MDSTLLTFILVVIGGIVFCVLLTLSAIRKNKGWPALTYALSLIPAGIQVWNHGFNLEALLAACFFLGLTWVILYFARKEIGESTGSP